MREIAGLYTCMWFCCHVAVLYFFLVVIKIGQPSLKNVVKHCFLFLKPLTLAHTLQKQIGFKIYTPQQEDRGKSPLRNINYFKIKNPSLSYIFDETICYVQV